MCCKKLRCVLLIDFKKYMEIMWCGKLQPGLACPPSWIVGGVGRRGGGGGGHCSLGYSVCLSCGLLGRDTVAWV